MSTAQKIFAFAVGVVLLLIFVGLGFGLANSGKDRTNENTAKVEKIMDAQVDALVDTYQGKKIKGRELINLIEQFSQDYKIIVLADSAGVKYKDLTGDAAADMTTITAKATDKNTYYDGATYATLANRDKINSAHYYDCRVYYTAETGDITTLVFIERHYS